MEPQLVAGRGIDAENLLGAQHDHLIVTAGLHKNWGTERISEGVTSPQNAAGLLFYGGNRFASSAAHNDESVAVKQRVRRVPELSPGGAKLIVEVAFPYEFAGAGLEGMQFTGGAHAKQQVTGNLRHDVRS